MADEVCRQIADEIVLGRFEPGSRLDEAMLANRFGVSRTPVREALKQLVSTGLVGYRPNRGSVVASLDAAQLDSMFEAIGELEAACARHAALRMTESERETLRSLHARGRQAMQARDLDGYDALNLELHVTILQGAHNAVLTETAVSLRQRVAPFRRTQFRNLERIGESFVEHCAIVDALLAHDAASAYREMRNHLLSARGAASQLAPAWSSAAPAQAGDGADCRIRTDDLPHRPVESAAESGHDARIPLRQKSS
ncbi:GntR family transcriptional regulator [Caenimonas soli]|uniref:GntR family transcriptional regulator n=1 Tax=Caenimonas soli TaxID=2735555 RepID=UPI001F2E4787|nr:GntR family transcriptional regulator [Caenimonas soli]